MDIQIIEKSLPIVKGNFEEVKKYLVEQLKKYETLIVTEDNLSDSKSVQRELAGLRNNIDTYRKDIKKEMTLPITEFENKCKELISIVKDTEEPIKEGIEVFNEKVRQEKLDYANEIILAHCNNFGVNATDFKILDSFTNLTATRKNIEKELDNQMQELVKIKEQKEKNIELLKQQVEQLNTTFELQSKIEFEEIENKITNDNFMELSQYLLTEANRRKQTEEKIAEQLLNKDKLEKEKAEHQKAEEQSKIIEEEIRTVDKITGEVFELKSIILKLTGTQEQLEGLKKYIDDSGIKYEKVKL